MGYCPIVLHKEMILYCNTINVSKVGKAGRNGNCIARSGWIVLQPGGKTVLQRLHCIATESAVGWIDLYCNRFKGIVE